MGDTSLFQVGEDVEFWRVLAHFSILAVCFLVLEYTLHCVERRLTRHDKYQLMLQKVYRELMILGLISLALKLLKDVTPLDHYHKPMLAFEVADLLIFGFAIALVLQALCISFQVRFHSGKIDRAELITTRDLLATFHKRDESKTRICGAEIPVIDKNIAKHRVLRHFFLRRFGLPQLFPFTKYIRRAQAHYLSYMIEVQPSMWFLMLIVAWGIYGLDVVLEGFQLMKILVIFAWGLVLLHILVLLYFRSCVRQLMEIGGYNQDKLVLYANLTAIAGEEDSAWESETAESAMDTLNRVHEQQEEFEHERKEARRGILKSDTGLQLTAASCSILWGTCRSEKTPKSGASDAPFRSNDVRLRFFSYKFWHVVVVLLLALNGFFVALFVQCALYNLDEIYNELGLICAVTVPLPMMLNALVFQSYIFRDFVLVCSILRLDANTLGDVASHFCETVELQSQFASSILQCLKDGGLTISYLEVVVQSHDLNTSGFVDIDNLRAIFASVGFSLSRFRFNSVVQLLFDLKGSNLAYAHLFQLLAVVQQGQEGVERPELRRSSVSVAQSTPTGETSTIQHFGLLAQASVASDLANSDFAFLRTVTPTLRRGSLVGLRGQPPNTKDESPGRRSLLQRSFTSQYTGSSSRVLHVMYNIREFVNCLEDSSTNEPSMV